MVFEGGLSFRLHVYSFVAADRLVLFVSGLLAIKRTLSSNTTAPVTSIFYQGHTSLYHRDIH